MATTVYEVDPISRIEGHLGVKVTVNSGTGKIEEANAHGNLWRGFENFLVGRRANDAITFTQRICGVCPVPHGTTAMYAAESVLDVSNGYMTFAQIDEAGDGVPKAAVLVRNIVLASEFLMSSITHFYHLAAQSYIQGPAIPPWTPYFNEDQYHEFLRNDHVPARAIPACDGDGHPVDLWSAVIKQYVKALRIRRLCLEAGALFAGRMPMTSTFVAGGTTNRFVDQDDFDAKCNAFRTMISEVGKFVISEYIPLALTLSYLYPNDDNVNNQPTVGGNGAGVGNFLAWGAFPGTGDGGDLFLKGGWKIKGGTSHELLTGRGNLDHAMDHVKANLKEFISRSRYANAHGYEVEDFAYPGDVTLTEPRRDLEDKYSWLKAPRWTVDGVDHPMEVGPLARMVINGKYLDDTTVNGGLLVSNESAAPDAVKAYYALYVAGAGLDPGVIHADLQAGLTATGELGATGLATVGGHILGLKGGLSTMDRLRARAIESFWMVNLLVGTYSKHASDSDLATFSTGDGLIDELQDLWATEGHHPTFYVDVPTPVGAKTGFGLTEAPRGALGHFVTADAGKIVSYQCVVPTTWNASPKDGDDVDEADASLLTATNTGATKRGPMEQAMIGVPFDATASAAVHGAIAGRISGVEVLRVAQSFDPCIACAVH
jgi:Ni,Fe-hydrogenase I large subunit